MNPLHRFGFTRNGPVDIDLADFDQLFIDGVSLVDYLKEYTPIQAFILIAKILPQVTQGLLYIYNAGILHKDVAPRSIIGTLLVDGNENVMTLAQHDHTTADIAV
ncbi:hypothetical protein BDF22DRAFT_652523 [Syncephalis plumigaleata]|nr:hypothetical protein BDF22DRAFT_652523 [Syncephalis plumigaleata]